jgi:hypothetical protein
MLSSPIQKNVLCFWSINRKNKIKKIIIGYEGFQIIIKYKTTVKEFEIIVMLAD